MITNLVLDVVAGETTRAASVQTIVLVVGADVDTLERGHGGADRQQRQRCRGPQETGSTPCMNDGGRKYPRGGPSGPNLGSIIR